MKIRSLILASLLTLSPVLAHGQTANGKATTSAPTYPNNQAAPLSLDTAGGLRVNCVSGCSGSGNSNAQATTAAPSYSNNTSNPISQDLSGNLRTSILTPLPVGTNNIGGIYINSTSVAKTDNVSNAANSTTTSGGAFVYQPVVPYNFNGTTWDRQRGDTKGSWVQGNVASGVADAGNPISIAGVYNSTIPSASSGQRGVLQLGPANGLRVIPTYYYAAMSDGQINSAGYVSNQSLQFSGSQISQSVYNSVFNGTSWDRQRGDTNGNWIVPSGSSSGTSNFSAILANSTNSTLVKNAAGIITEISVYNSSATIAWLKLYNASSAPTCGSGTPVGRYMIPGAASGGAGSNVSIDLGKAFSTGIAFCVTTGIADTDTGAVAASTYTVNMTYK